MTQDNDQTQDQGPMAGRAVERTGQAVESVANQVESAAVSATDFASDEVIGRALGYIRAAKNILAAGVQSGVDVGSGAFDLLLREAEELNETAKTEIRNAAGGSQ